MKFPKTIFVSDSTINQSHVLGSESMQQAVCDSGGCAFIAEYALQAVSKVELNVSLAPVSEKKEKVKKEKVKKEKKGRGRGRPKLDKKKVIKRSRKA